MYVYSLFCPCKEGEKSQIHVTLFICRLKVKIYGGESRNLKDLWFTYTVPVRREEKEGVKRQAAYLTYKAWLVGPWWCVSHCVGNKCTLRMQGGRPQWHSDTGEPSSINNTKIEKGWGRKYQAQATVKTPYWLAFIWVKREGAVQKSKSISKCFSRQKAWWWLCVCAKTEQTTKWMDVFCRRVSVAVFRKCQR